MDATGESQTILSFCSGTLGLERGVERVIGTVRIAAYVEIESYICQNLVRQMEAGVLAPAPVYTNLKTFPASRFRNRIHGITAGYPCQPFSNAGEQKGVDDERHLFPHLLTIIDTVRPLWCFFENVRAHLTMGYSEVYASLRDIGYTVESGIFSAAEAGAPHNRERLFILAMDYSERERLEGFKRHGTHAQGWQGQGRSAAARSLFPAKYGEDQLEWEHQRTIEPMVGCTVNGYNFRDDLLRALGNSVVEQSAEIAFRNLINLK